MIDLMEPSQLNRKPLTPRFQICRVCAVLLCSHVSQKGTIPSSPPICSKSSESSPSLMQRDGEEGGWRPYSEHGLGFKP